MIEAIRLVMRRGPAYGHSLNVKKRVYLMAPLGRDASQRELDVRMRAVVNLGAPIEDVKAHPDCQLSASPSTTIKRRIERGFKILGAFVGADDYVLCQLRSKMSRVDRVTDLLIQHPRAQLRRRLRRLCYDAKVNYWLRAQSPLHGRRLVDDFRRRQMRLAASRHGIYEATEFEDRWSDAHGWRERATLPIEAGGVATRDMGTAALTAFA